MGAFGGGYLRLGRLRGVPVFMHWSAPLGALLVSRFRWLPGAWVAFVVLVLVHEAGHALLVQRVGARAVAIELHALGGECRWQGTVSPLGRAMVAWGGVLAQGVVLSATYAALALAGPPSDPFLGQMAMAFTTSNITMIAFNLFPMRPLDGAEAWRIVPLLRERWRAARARGRRARVHRYAAREAEASDRVGPRGKADAAADDLFAKLEKDGVVNRVHEPQQPDD